MSSLVLVIAPTELPVELDRVKEHLRVDHDDDDDLIGDYISAAVDDAEKFLGRALIDQTFDYFLDEFPADEIVLPLSPVIAVVGVFYQDNAGDEQEFTEFEADTASEPARVYLPSGGSWPTAATTLNAVRVRFRAGYLDTGVSPAVENVPPAVKAAILIGVAELYANREQVMVGQTVAHLPSWERLLRRYRIALGMA